MRFFFLIPILGFENTEKFISGSRELVSMIVLHIHDIIRYSQKKMTEKYILYIHFKILEQTCGNKSPFCIFKDKKK